MKTVLITGANSYIGTSFEKYVEQHYARELKISTLDMIDGSWRSTPFKDENGKPYDIIFHVAGLAHADVGKVSWEIKDKYYRINTDLAIECAKKAKADGCAQFVFMSSMIVYGSQQHISRRTKPHPSNFYGDSKWRADKGIRALREPGKFETTILRPPMIYGKGSKGNYPALSRLANRIPIFPKYQNKRSMLYIENLCEFLSLVMIKSMGGVYFPQNAEYSSTSTIVKEIARAHGKKILITKLLNPAVAIAKRFPVRKIRDLANKAFGDSWYEQSLSVYENLNYQVVGLKESIRRTEIHS